MLSGDQFQSPASPGSAKNRKTRPRTVTKLPARYDKLRDHFVTTICDHETPVVRGPPPLTCSFTVGLAGFEPATP